MQSAKAYVMLHIVQQREQGLFYIDQAQYVNMMLTKYKFQDASPIVILVDPNVHCNLEGYMNTCKR